MVTPLGQLLSPLEQGDPGARVRQVWRAAVGERIAARTRAQRLSGSVLTVEVASPVWAQELSLLSATILERLVALGVTATRLRFRVGHFDPKPAPRPQPSRVQRAVLPQQLEQRIQRVGDPELREALRSAAELTLGRAASWRSAAQRHNSARRPRPGTR